MIRSLGIFTTPLNKWSPLCYYRQSISQYHTHRGYMNSEKRMAPGICSIIFLIGLFTMSAGVFAQDISGAVQASSQNSCTVDLLQFKTPDSLTFCGEHVPLERRDVWERLDKQFMLSLGRQAQVIL